MRGQGAAAEGGTSARGWTRVWGRANPSTTVRIVATFRVAGLSPLQLRERFLELLRDSIARQAIRGKLEFAIADELLRAVPVGAQS